MYLIGLRGTAKELDLIGRKNTATMLDRESTQTLASASPNWSFLDGRDGFALTGVPIDCCSPVT